MKRAFAVFTYPLSVPDCEPETLKRDPTDCRQFFLCSVDGTSYRFRCPRDLVFSVASGLCETRDKVPDCSDNAGKYKNHHNGTHTYGPVRTLYTH